MGDGVCKKPGCKADAWGQGEARGKGQSRAHKKRKNGTERVRGSGMNVNRQKDVDKEGDTESYRVWARSEKGHFH